MVRRRISTPILLALIVAITLFLWKHQEEEMFIIHQDLIDPFLANLSSPPSLRRSASLNFSKSSMYLNLTQFSESYPALQTYRCRMVIGLVGYCRTQDPLIILAVKSHPGSFERREVLRSTWARETMIQMYKFKPLFLLANSGRRNEMEKMMLEAAFYGDIILWDFMESHHNLSLKEKCFLEWLYHRCQRASYIFKVDDDEFVNPHAIAAYINSVKDLPPQIHGHRHLDAPVERYGKYAIPTSVYPYKTYPPFVSGGGFIIPSPLIPRLFEASGWMPVFPLDDVFLGFLALAANISFRHEAHFFSFGLENHKPCSLKDVLAAHGLPQPKIMKLWKLLPYIPPCPPDSA
ncbi:beta-1,3-galactosyltransferase 5-like [Spea bombifrons]|uniref:beta-1,3-galactosyltransferase 5-like n=1 Tax=Spea bombifrons TaxID=233779 RepID=UPI002349D595|nr:beta-1,3-galactosyltransferase 5-like [Spea bombifrons]XP_053321043.1 beta-1,3-galactosyltransferase 5-like [Spea bombifrons]XP_053321044.1 beta-1,3-galactosyltransferase 5-like [Spea bombifrons]